MKNNRRSSAMSVFKVLIAGQVFEMRPFMLIRLQSAAVSLQKGILHSGFVLPRKILILSEKKSDSAVRICRTGIWKNWLSCAKQRRTLQIMILFLCMEQQLLLNIKRICLQERAEPGKAPIFFYGKRNCRMLIS